jgi:hypothetical protein
MGTIGDGPGVKFRTYRKQAANLPHARDILSGKVTKLNVKQIDIMYALTTSLAYALIDSSARATAAAKLKDDKPTDELHREIDFFNRFMMDNFEDELTIMGAKIIFGTHKIPIKINKLKTWKEFCERYNDLIPNN